MMKNNDLILAQDNLINKTIEIGAHWRILRLDSIIDLMIMHLSIYLNKKKHDHLINMLEYYLVYKYNSKYGIEISDKFYQSPISEKEKMQIVASIRDIVTQLMIHTSNEETSYEIILEYLHTLPITDISNKLDEMLNSTK